MTEAVAVVTGGSSGIGLSVAKRLSHRMPVAIVARSAEKLAKAKSEIESSSRHAKVLAIVADVREPGDVKSAVNKVTRELGDVGVLINSAGIGGGGRTLEFPYEKWLEIINTNLNGTFLFTTEILRQSRMLEKRWGRIVNIASTGGKQGVVYAAAYCASKHGVVGFSKSLGLELAKTGVTVNAVCPGFVETEMAVRAREGYSRVWECTIDEAKLRIEQRIPMGRYVSPEEVADTVDFLAGPHAAAILGQAINVCGGLGNY